MATLGVMGDETLPTPAQVAEVQAFLTELETIKSSLEKKKAEAQKVIRSKMQDLHQLIAKWETRFLDTMAETLDEKIEGVAKQQEKLKSTIDWINEQRKTKRMSIVFPRSLRSDSPQPVANEADTEEGLQRSMAGDVGGFPLLDEEEERPEEELAKKHWRVWKALNFPLQPTGVTKAEINVDLWNEFGQLLEESRKSLKRSMLFVGGIIRAYMRRGHKRDEWVAMVRRLEARVEAPPTSSLADFPLDPALAAFPNMSSLRSGQGSLSPTPATRSATSSLLLAGLGQKFAPANFPTASTPAFPGAPNFPGASSIFNTVWILISDIFKYRNTPTIKGPLTKQLSYIYTNYPAFVEFFLPQLSNLMLCNKEFPLTEFIFDCCHGEAHFALQTYFLVSSLAQVGSAKWQKRCIKICKQIVSAIPVAQLGGRLPPKKSHQVVVLPNLPSVEPPIDGKTQAILSEFPLGLPTDSHNLMLLFSPRSSSNALPAPKPTSTSQSTPASSAASTSELGQSGGYDVASDYSTSPETTTHMSRHRGVEDESNENALSAVAEESEGSDSTSTSTTTTTNTSIPSQNAPSPTPQGAPAIKLTNSQSLAGDEPDNDQHPLLSASTGEVTVYDGSKHSGYTPDEGSSHTMSLAIPIRRATTPPPQLYTYSPVNSPIMLSENLLGRPDLTAEIKAAMTTATDALAKTGAQRRILTGDAAEKPIHLIELKDVKPSDSSQAQDSSSTATASPATHDLLAQHKQPSSESLVSQPKPGDPHGEAYNSDDPEEELKRLTRITKPPTVSRVEKNLEVPVGKEYFFTQVKFMRKLIDISRKLGELYGKPETYKPALDRELDALSPYIETGFAYMLRAGGLRTRVLRFVLTDCHPIPTYGRVLYRMIMEVVDLPSHYTKEMADEYVRLKKDFKSFSHTQTTANPSSPSVQETPTTPANPTQAVMGTNAFGDSWKDVRRRIKASSKYSSLPHWDVRAYIVKHGDLVLQEQFVMQLLVQFQQIWEMEGLPLKLCCYNILATSYQSGLIEVVPNSISLDKLKKVTEKDGNPLSLAEFFKKHWATTEDFKKARTNFIASLAAYSVVCYLLQIKDRHNGNIMLDADGCIFHIDFGYLLARTIKFERAPFKLTDEFIEVLGGDQSKSFKAYCNLVVLGFLAVRKHHEKIQLMVEMTSGEGNAIPCLEGDSVAPNLKKRFHLEWTEKQCEEFILGIIGEARDNWRTQIYDSYQRIVNDIH